MKDGGGPKDQWGLDEQRQDSIQDLLGDPIVKIIMDYDGIRREDVLDTLAAAARAINDRGR